MPARPRIAPPVGKSGPGTISHQLLDGRCRACPSAPATASMTSPRLCGGMLVAMPTAMPPAPLTSRFGKRAGRTTGSLLLAVVVRLEVDGVLVDVLEQRHRGLREPRLRCSAWPPADRRRPSRNCPARRSAAARIEKVLRHAHQRVVDRDVAVRVVLAHRRRRRCGPICRTAGRACSCSRASRTGCADAPASGRRARPAARG